MNCAQNLVYWLQIKKIFIIDVPYTDRPTQVATMPIEMSQCLCENFGRSEVRFGALFSICV